MTTIPEFKNLLKLQQKIITAKRLLFLVLALDATSSSISLQIKSLKNGKQNIFERLSFLAPAFAGAGQTLDVAWNRYFPVLPILKNDIITEAIMRVPVISALFPNHIVFKDYAVIKGPNNEQIYPDGVVDFFINHGKLTGKWGKMAKANAKF